MTLAETDHLLLRRLREDDAAFILELVNEPGWLKFIGDRGIRNWEDARLYIVNGPPGMCAVVRRADGVEVGICGLLKRETLDDMDLGFALLERYEGKGYAREAARAMVAYGFDRLGLERIAAITKPTNHASIRLLDALGFEASGKVNSPDPVCLFLLRKWSGAKCGALPPT